MKKPIRYAAGLAVVALAFPAYAAAAVSQPVRSVDNIPPESVTSLVALDSETGVVLTWSLSVDDAVNFTPFGDAIVPRGGVLGYRIYRESDELGEELVTSLAPGVSEFIDAGAAGGVTYKYSVRPFDRDNETALAVDPGSADDLARIVALGGAPSVVVVVSVQGSMTFDVELDLEDEVAVDSFEADFIALVSAELGISADRIRIVEIRAGSVIVDFEILEPPEGVEEPAAADALSTLIALIEDTETDEFVTLAPVLAIADETTSEAVVIPKPVDPDGNPILGWFTRTGDSVGLNDFFAFGDVFGSVDGDLKFDPVFDIAGPDNTPDGAIGLDDFFKFGDDFGKTVANAAEIQGLLGN